MYATDFSQVGSNIKAVLDTHGKTQQYLADRLSVSKQVMNKIIKGTKAINVNEIAQIAEVLGVTTDSLLKISNKYVSTQSLSSMKQINDRAMQKKIDFLLNAIDEIHLLESLVDEGNL